MKTAFVKNVAISSVAKWRGRRNFVSRPQTLTSFRTRRSDHEREARGDMKSLGAFAEAFRLVLAVVAVIIPELWRVQIFTIQDETGKACIYLEE